MHTISTVNLGEAQHSPRISKKRIGSINISLVVLALLITIFGLVVVYSATLNTEAYSFARQVVFVFVGVALMFFLFKVDYHRFAGMTKYMIIISTVLTLLPHLPIIGTSANGATSWISIGGIGLQPGELAKVTVILMAAGCVSKYKGRLNSLKEYGKCIGLMLIPFLGIMTQPDLGTGLVYLFIDAVALLVGGAKPRYLIGTVVLLALAVGGLFAIDPILDNALGHDVLLKDYQRARLLVFMDNGYDPAGDGYNLQQAKIAIGSGGLFGKGYLHATQSTLGYLPESATDFIFCVLAEELGFVGAMVLIALYVALIVKCFAIARKADDLFGCIIVMCIAGMWLFQILENIGMDIGLMPITGIPLPFVSYGSSFMIVNFILLGLTGSVWSFSKR